MQNDLDFDEQPIELAIGTRAAPVDPEPTVNVFVRTSDHTLPKASKLADQFSLGIRAVAPRGIAFKIHDRRYSDLINEAEKSGLRVSKLEF